LLKKRVSYNLIKTFLFYVIRSGTPSVCARVDCPGNTCRSIRRGRALGGTISSLAENMCVESAVRSLITAAGNITEFCWLNISWGTSLRYTRYKSKPTNRLRCV